MRRYDDPVEVRLEARRPDHFLWRGHVWKVRNVVLRWVETGAWWSSPRAQAVLGADDPRLAGAPSGGGAGTDLLEEREVWRLEAARPGGQPRSVGTFELVHEVGRGSWRLVGCSD